MNLLIFLITLLLSLVLPHDQWLPICEPQEIPFPAVLSYETASKSRGFIADHRDLVNIKVSPNGKYIGELYSWQLAQGGEDYDFFIYDTNTTATKKIFSIGPHFSTWEWLDNDRIKLRMGCGTNCVAFKVMSGVTSVDKYVDYRAHTGDGWWTESPGYEPPSI